MVLIVAFNSLTVIGQSPCTPNTPSFKVDLSGNPDSVWISEPSISRDGSCCGSQSPDRCIEFELTLDTNVIAINFEIEDGAIPPGAMFYQTDCSPPARVGEPICVSGPGPIFLTFCKPGKNKNNYKITGFSAPEKQPNRQVNIGCDIDLSITGLTTSTVEWNDITSGTQQYNSYLSCTSGCDSVKVTPDDNAPSFVDYQVCGEMEVQTCLASNIYCDTMRVNFHDNLTTTISASQTTFCNTDVPQTLTATATGGDGDYTYIWYKDGSPFASDTNVVEISSSGFYISEVRDGNYPNCPSAVSNITIEVNEFHQAAFNPLPICEGDSIELNPTTTGTDITWIGNFNDDSTYYLPSPSESTFGSASIGMIFNNNAPCPNDTLLQTVNIRNNLSLDISGTILACNGNNTSLTANLQNGISPISYSWSNGSNSNQVNVGGGTYIVTASDLGFPSCSISDTVTVTNSPALQASFNVSNPNSCNDAINISISVSGGTQPYSYSWDNGTSTSTNITTFGTSQVTITDSLGCSITIDTTITAPNAQFTVSINAPARICGDNLATISAIASNNSLTYTYDWSTNSNSATIVVPPGQYCVEVTDQNDCSISECTEITQSNLDYTLSNDTTVCNGDSGTIQIQYNDNNTPNVQWENGDNDLTKTLPAGSYAIILSNDDNCLFHDTVNITETTPLFINSSEIEPSCNGYNDGQITLSISGSLPGYTIVDNRGNIVSSPITSLSAATYTYYVTDQLGCSDSISTTLNEPNELEVTNVAKNNSTCFGFNDGNISFSSTGGSGTITYWLDRSINNTGSFSNLSPGTYNLKVIDENNCRDSVFTAIIQPNKFTTSYSIDSVQCYNDNSGSITAQGTGGTTPYTFNWLDLGLQTNNPTSLAAGTYNVIARDSNNCSDTAIINIPSYDSISITSSISDILCFGESNGQIIISSIGGNGTHSYSWSNANINDTLYNLTAGNYSLTVTDENNCSKSEVYTVSQPSASLSLTTSGNQSILCDATSELWVQANGGTTPYSYNWNIGSTNDTISGLNSGSYFVVVSDINNCFDTAFMSITSTNTNLAIEIQSNDIVCYDSSTTLIANPSLGNAPYSIEWSTTATDTFIIEKAGSYCATVTDRDNCKETICKTITQSDSIIMTPTAPIICIGDSFMMTNSISGGTAPYTVNWPTLPKADSNYMQVGTYSFEVTDSLNCPGNGTVTVTEETQMEIVFDNVFPVKCKDGNDGGFTFEVSEGIPPYTYEFEGTSISNPQQFFLSTGTYLVSAIDSIGCLHQDSILIEEPSAYLTSSKGSTTQPTCFSFADGIIQSSGVGGVEPYLYYWEHNGDTNNLLSNIDSGTYFLSIIDSFGCEVFDTFEIDDPEDFDISTIINHLKCNNILDGSITLSVTGATKPYSYSWSSSEVDSFITNKDFGTYTATITDSNNCDTTMIFQVDSAPILNYDISFNDSLCPGTSSNATVQLNQNQRGASVYWVDSNITRSFITIYPDSTSMIHFQIQDDSNCVYNDSFTLIVRSTSMGTTDITASNIQCKFDTVPISVGHSGPNPPYLYSWEKDFSGTGNFEIILSEEYNNILTITDICNNQSFDTLTIQQYPYPTLTQTWEDSFQNCVPFQHEINSISVASFETAFWTIDGEIIDSSESFTYLFNSPGEYDVDLWIRNIYGCFNKEDYQSSVTVHSLPIANFTLPFDSIYMSSPNISLFNTSVDNDSNAWVIDNNNFNTEDLEYAFSDSGIYPISLAVYNQFRCADTILKTLLVKPLNSIEIPNAFSPDPNGSNGGSYIEGETNNNVFHPHTSQVTQYQLNIFNRWGELIFESFDVNIGWDGYYRNKLSEQGTYIWKIDITFENGDRFNKVGDVLLVR